MRDDLIRRGLPARQSVRYARELQAHWEDLRDERLAAGSSADGAAAEAEAEADRRLGAPADLVAAALLAHRRESFGGRHPLLGFLVVPFVLVPLLSVLLVLLLLLLSLAFGEPAEDGDARALTEATAAGPAQASAAILASYAALHAWSLGMPAAVALWCHWRARRRMLSAAWGWAASAAVAVSAGMQNAHLGWWPRAERPIHLSFGYGGWPDPVTVAAVLTAALLAGYVGRRGVRPRPAVRAQ